MVKCVTLSKVFKQFFSLFIPIGAYQQYVLCVYLCAEMRAREKQRQSDESKSKRKRMRFMTKGERERER